MHGEVRLSGGRDVGFWFGHGDWRYDWRRSPHWRLGRYWGVAAIPDGFAGSLPKAGSDPDHEHQLADQKGDDCGFGSQLGHPEVQAESDDEAGDDAGPQINPEQREKITEEQAEGEAQCFVHAFFIFGDGDDLGQIEPNPNEDHQEQNYDHGGFEEMNGGEGRDRTFVNAVVHRTGERGETADRQKYDQHI